MSGLGVAQRAVSVRRHSMLRKPSHVGFPHGQRADRASQARRRRRFGSRFRLSQDGGLRHYAPRPEFVFMLSFEMVKRV